jgi:hypothetical protein
MSQQILQSASGNQSFIPKGLQLIDVMVQLLILRVTQGSVLLIVFIIIIVVVVVLIIVVVVVVGMVLIILRQL